MKPQSKVVDVDNAQSGEVGYYSFIQSRIEAAGGEFVLASASTEEEVIAASRDAAVILVERQTTPITAKVLDRLPVCQAIMKCSVGYNGVDIDAATRQGIVLCNAAGYSAEDVSDHAIALLMSCARGIHLMDRNIHKGGWFDFPQTGPIRRLKKLTLGVIGFGAIGSVVVRKMAGFRMRILVDDPYVERPPGIEFVDLPTLLRESDIVSLHVPLTEETHNLLGAEEFAAMKPTSILINTSRGAVVNEEALAQALKERRISAAGLDVMVEEPLPGSSPLLQLDNVVLTPHYAGHSADALVALRDLIADSTEAVLTGHLPPFVINPAVGPRIPLKPWKHFAESRAARQQV